MPERDFLVYDAVATPVFVLVPQSDGVVRYAAFNATACEIARFRLHDVLGKTPVELYGPQMGGHAMQVHLGVLKARKALTYDLKLPLGSGVRHIRTTLTPVLGQGGRVSHLVGTSVDRTDEVVAYEARSAAEAVAEEAEDFIALAAHDLRSPMRFVRSCATMLRDEIEGADADTLDLVDMIVDVADKAAGQIDDVLTCATADTAAAATSVFSLAELAQEILTTLAPGLRERLTVEPAQIRGDRTAFMIVLRNLADNAVKHAGAEMLALSVKVEPGAPDGQVTIALHDNGKGFDDPTVAFLDGGRLDKGSGFGLLAVQRLIRARGGAIEASNHDGGATVRFTLPGEVVVASETTSDAA